MDTAGTHMWLSWFPTHEVTEAIYLLMENETDNKRVPAFSGRVRHFLVSPGNASCCRLMSS